MSPRVRRSTTTVRTRCRSRLSREGQILQYATTFEVPVHKALQLAQFVPFADTINGKFKSVRDDALLTSDLNKKMTEQWDRYWNGSGTTKKD